MTAVALPSIELVPLFRGIWKLAPYRTVGKTPAGTRMIIEMPEGRVDGERLKASVVGGSRRTGFSSAPTEPEPSTFAERWKPTTAQRLHAR